MLGFGLGIGQIRRGRRSLGGALASVCVAIVVLAAVLGNLRPLAGLLAWGLLIAAFVADEGGRRAVALGCFSAGFLALVVTVFYA